VRLEHGVVTRTRHRSRSGRSTNSQIDAPWHEIVPGLWQGAGTTSPDGFDVVLTCSRTAVKHPPPRDATHWQFLFRDGRRVPESGQIWAWARRINDELVSGHRVLVRCKAGLNRSGLLVAATLVLRGASPDEAVAQVRQHRSPRALNNPHFVRWLLESRP
jgi:protein-tyrosine phosphatase